MSEARDAIPLTPVTYEVLLALADRASHGYGIIKEIERRTDGSVSVETGTLYHALKRMTEENMIERVTPSERPASEDKRRRSYRLTPWGKEVLAAESERLRTLVEVAVQKRVIPVRST